MAYFECIVGNGGGTQGIPLTVTCDSVFAGLTITATDGTTTLTQQCPSTSPYVVNFNLPNTGTWTVSGTVSGTSYSEQITISEYAIELLAGFNWETWVNNSIDLDSTDYPTLADLLSDESAVRELCLVHACVDYMCLSINVNTDLSTIINNDLFAKWVNLSDYALDSMYANAAIKTAMDTADKYGYGEWVITDDTTTPPTWGAKGNVPVMTSNTAPYGEASASNELSGYNAYKAFDKVDTSANSWFINTTGNNALPSDTHIKYKFTNPVLAKKAFIGWYDSYPSGMTATIKIQGSNDANTWNDVSEEITFNNGEAKEVELTSSEYYLYYKLLIVSQTGINISYYYGGVHTLQFYGRALDVSVPVMTSNTAPYGNVVFTDEQSSYYGWYAFNKSSDSWSRGAAGEGFIGYKFPSPVNIRKVSYSNFALNNGYGIGTFKIQYSDDGIIWEDASSVLTAAADTNEHIIDITDNGSHKYWNVYIITSNPGFSTIWASVQELNFYGVDYSEKEFEEGTNKKWLYDHGVELETIDAYYVSSITHGTLTKESNDLIPDSSGGPQFVAAGCVVNLTPYSAAWAKAEYMKSASSANGEWHGIRIGAADSSYNIGNVAESQATMSYPSLTYMDMTSINSTYGIVMATYKRKAIFTELWIE